MNDVDAEIDRTEKISYRQDNISANTINSQIAYSKTSVHMYSIIYYIHVHILHLDRGEPDVSTVDAYVATRYHSFSFSSQ